MDETDIQFDNAGAMMSVDDTLLCSFQVSSLARTVLQLILTSDPETRREEGAKVRRLQRTAPVRHRLALQRSPSGRRRVRRLACKRSRGARPTGKSGRVGGAITTTTNNNNNNCYNNVEGAGDAILRYTKPGREEG